jgi:D-glycero-D-manno-heptose 1,7-bisphosphate phosphatase
MNKQPAVFLDRDGVVIENQSDYVKSWDEVHFIPGAFQALKKLAGSSYLVIFVTNQSAVGRGIITMEEVLAINEQAIATIIMNGGRVEGVYICPHRPDEDCNCRKPKPGLLLQAAEELRVDLSRSYLVGDALSDLQAANTAGVAGILVLTGRGQDQVSMLHGTEGYRIVADLQAAVDYILSIKD